MTTHNAPASRATIASGPADGQRIDPLIAQTMARYARQQAIARFLAAVGKSLVAAIASQFRNRAVYQDLSELPDHLLNDIGIRRDQVAAIAYGGLARQPTDLEAAAGRGSLSFFEPKPAAAAAAQTDPRDSHNPLAA